MNWGHKLIISLVVFAGIMATMVVMAFQQNFDLVDFQYYKKEIEFQDQIDKTKNASQKKAVSFELINEKNVIELNFTDKVNSGIIHLFRPSDERQDLKINMNDETDLKVRIPTRELIAGLWKIKMDWTSGEDEFYFEKEFVIQ